jgi:hypothetical protein
MPDINYTFKCDHAGCNFEKTDPMVSEVRRDARAHVMKTHNVMEPDPADIDRLTVRSGV